MLTLASTIKNQLKSPLLRLPAELRNNIYEYVCGGLIICPTAIEASPYRLWSRHQRDSLDSDWKPLESPTKYLLVCRQMHAEMALLVLKLNDFGFLHFRYFSHFVSRLSEQQRAAITSVIFALIDNNVSRVIEQQAKAWIYAVRPFECRGVFDRNMSFPLERLPGLTRMVVEVENMKQEEWRFEWQRGFIRGMIMQWGGPDGLGIVFRQWLGNLR
jgi:hypothetical protein